jgi:ribonuclease HI
MIVIKERVQLFTDGACKGNPGVGGWGALIESSYFTKELKGYEQLTTNNRMELIAVIEGVNAIEKNTTIEITTDSMYVKNGISQWIDNWKKNDWKTSAKKPVKNKELWLALDKLVQNYSIEWKWVKGHSGHPGNERADQLANAAISEFYSLEHSI